MPTVGPIARPSTLHLCNLLLLLLLAVQIHVQQPGVHRRGSGPVRVRLVDLLTGAGGGGQGPPGVPGRWSDHGGDPAAGVRSACPYLSMLRSQIFVS